MAGYNIEQVRQRVHDNLPGFLRDLYPNGKVQGNDYLIGDFDGNPGKSTKITLSGEGAGLGCDNSTKEGFDIYGMYGRAHGIDHFPTILQEVAKWAGVLPTGKPAQKRKAIKVVKPYDMQEAIKQATHDGKRLFFPCEGHDLDIPTTPYKMPDYQLVDVYEYSIAQGMRAVFVARYEDGKGNKTIRQYSMWIPADCKTETRNGIEILPPNVQVITKAKYPKPLKVKPFGWEAMNKAHPNIWWEGEKDCKKGCYCGLWPDANHLAVIGSKGGIDKTDFSDCAGSNNIIMHDNDEAGEQYALLLSDALNAAGATTTKIRKPLPGKPKGWSFADDLN